MKSILKISKERISNTFLSLNLGEVVMKKLNVFELKQVSGGDSLGARVPSVRELLREVGLEVGLKYLSTFL